MRKKASIISLGVLLLAGCGRQEAGHHVAESSAHTSSNHALADELSRTNVLGIRSFSARGIIRELPVGGRSVVISHEAIPGFMAKMTMEFSVRNTNELKGLRAGDPIAFLVKATVDDSWIENLQRVSKGEVPSIAPTAPSITSLLHTSQLKRGDVLPDAELLTEDGRSLKLSAFQGSALAFTFIFTRCPLPDFCPRMNQHFSRARELLTQQPGGPTNWQFLSISFDPEFDKPGVLKRYASNYRGIDPDRWLFAVAQTNVTAFLGAQVDFRFANDGGGFAHNLRTVVLDPWRRIRRQFEGSKWKPEELAQAMAEAARAKD